MRSSLLPSIRVQTNRLPSTFEAIRTRGFFTAPTPLCVRRPPLEPAWEAKERQPWRWRWGAAQPFTHQRWAIWGWFAESSHDSRLRARREVTHVTIIYPVSAQELKNWEQSGEKNLRHPRVFRWPATHSQVVVPGVLDILPQPLSRFPPTVAAIYLELEMKSKPRCSPWCWNMYQQLPGKSPSIVGLYIPVPIWERNMIYWDSGHIRPQSMPAAPFSGRCFDALALSVHFNSRSCPFISKIISCWICWICWMFITISA